MAYNSAYSGAQIDEAVRIALNIYPVGSIYLSTSSTNPGTLFGGTWNQIKDKFLLACGSTYDAGSSGGAAAHVHSTNNHTLTIAEMPKHGHVVYVWDNAGTMANAWYYNGANRATHSGARLYNGSASTWIASGSTANAAGSGRGDPSGGTNQIGGGRPQPRKYRLVKQSPSVPRRLRLAANGIRQVMIYGL